jgi:hypothetical protein
MDLPNMIRIRQNFEAPVLKNIPQEIASQLDRLGVDKKVNQGQTVAVACSSRGIANYTTIVKATIRSLLELGLKPFIVPAMGSHGAATAEGQKRILENYGISEISMGVPIQSSLEIVQIGETEDQIPVFLDGLASEADYIVPINRIKSHTDFEFEIESGLMKMLVIGLGKPKGVAVYHQAFFRFGYPRVILTVARKVLQSGRILFGVGIVENGYYQTAKIGVLASHELEEREKELLKEAKRLEPRLPFADVDVLIIDEMGKNISGTGVDTKIIGRIYLPLITKEPQIPRIKRIIICNLTNSSEGNALGVGLADFVTKRLANKVDMDATYVNAIIGGCPEQAKIPITLRNDREAIDVAIGSIERIPFQELRIMRIKNTKHLEEVDISQAYKKELSQRNELQITAETGPLPFDKEGNLEPF